MGEQQSKLNKGIDKLVFKTYTGTRRDSLPSQVTKNSCKSANLISTYNLHLDLHETEHTFTFIEDKNWLAVAGITLLGANGQQPAQHQVQIYRLPQMKRIKSIPLAQDSQHALYFLPNSTKIISTWSGMLHIVDIRSSRITISIHTVSNVTCMSYIPTKLALLTCGSSKGLRLWDLSTGCFLASYFEDIDYSNFVYWEERNLVVATGRDHGSVSVIDIRTGLKVAEIKGPKIGGVLRSYSNLRILSISKSGYFALRGSPTIHYEGSTSTGFLLYHLNEDAEFKDITFLNEVKKQEFRSMIVIEDIGLIAGVGYNGEITLVRIADMEQLAHYDSASEYFADIHSLMNGRLFTIIGNKAKVIKFVRRRWVTDIEVAEQKEPNKGSGVEEPDSANPLLVAEATPLSS